MNKLTFKMLLPLLLVALSTVEIPVSAQEDVGKACWIHEMVCAREQGILRDYPLKKPAVLTQKYCCAEAALAKCYRHKLTIDPNCKDQTSLVPATDPQCAHFQCTTF